LAYSSKDSFANVIKEIAQQIDFFLLWADRNYARIIDTQSANWASVLSADKIFSLHRISIPSDRSIMAQALRQRKHFGDHRLAWRLMQFCSSRLLRLI